jgi:hypothetical protein
LRTRQPVIKPMQPGNVFTLAGTCLEEHAWTLSNQNARPQAVSERRGVKPTPGHLEPAERNTFALTGSLATPYKVRQVESSGPHDLQAQPHVLSHARRLRPPH